MVSKLKFKSDKSASKGIVKKRKLAHPSTSSSGSVQTQDQDLENSDGTEWVTAEFDYDLNGPCIFINGNNQCLASDGAGKLFSMPAPMSQTPQSVNQVFILSSTTPTTSSTSPVLKIRSHLGRYISVSSAGKSIATSASTPTSTPASQISATAEAIGPHEQFNFTALPNSKWAICLNSSSAGSSYISIDNDSNSPGLSHKSTVSLADSFTIRVQAKFRNRPAQLDNSQLKQDKIHTKDLELKVGRKLDPSTIKLLKAAYKGLYS
ncbi:uncharacterized protein V1516DRAFT_608833, partial [Lipomyces oligophaga]|uniref:uncharacterized protein n=1 Tax=Lipomyces oligophaga TaxID=45792 RepID=UPI0034CE7B3C